jgi:hypothetical protein
MKKSSYQKLKDENAQLKRDINTLVLFPDSCEASFIRIKVEMKKGFEDAIIFGSRNYQTPKELIEAFTQ